MIEYQRLADLAGMEGNTAAEKRIRKHARRLYREGIIPFSFELERMARWVSRSPEKPESKVIQVGLRAIDLLKAAPIIQFQGRVDLGNEMLARISTDTSFVGEGIMGGLPSSLTVVFQKDGDPNSAINKARKLGLHGTVDAFEIGINTFGEGELKFGEIRRLGVIEPGGIKLVDPKHGKAIHQPNQDSLQKVANVVFNYLDDHGVFVIRGDGSKISSDEVIPTSLSIQAFQDSREEQE